jgi:hypothetical protein
MVDIIRRLFHINIIHRINSWRDISWHSVELVLTRNQHNTHCLLHRICHNKQVNLPIDQLI